jgi:DNA processing protein
MEATRAERTALIALLQTLPKEQSWPGLAARVAERGSAVAVWEDQHEAPALFGSDETSTALDKARSELELWDREGLCVLTVLDEDYPAQLREIKQIPPVLFARGRTVQGDRGVSVVGSRKASAGALTFAAAVAERLVHAGITVVAGLAEGVDTAAHTTALHAGGRTVAFIGTGIRKYFPAANRALQDRIAAEGLLMSQFWPDAPGLPPHFLMRNAVMSGYGRATVVVEAGETSGTRAQARMAVEHGRPVVLTDRVATGTNWGSKLVDRPGVYVASTPDEVMDIVGEVTLPLQDRIGDLLSTP